ncbi:MAG: hypothetical protein JWR53_733 [Glaciihabitans sp.]|nr:hypothetical protein [Glaciihabitans sp.]
MKGKTFAKFGIGFVAAAVMACTISVPAFADPASTNTFGTLVGVGSDTTQDVLNGVAGAIGGTDGVRIASYDALGSQKITTRKNSATQIFRPNGSGNGRDVLRVSIGNLPSTAATVAGAAYTWNAETVGQVDFARSSGGIASGTAAADGVLTYIPFAVDAVDYAVSDTSLIPNNLTKGNSSDAADVDGVAPNTLYAIYHGIATKIVTDVDGNFVKLVNNSYAPASGESLVPIHAYVPQAGSGTRSFWLTQLGFTETNITNGDVPVKDVFGPNNTSVQEHDGSSLVGDPGAIMPFSVGQWVAQSNNIDGVTDRRHSAVLGHLNGQDPVIPAGTLNALNPEYTAITRNVYNIVPSAKADDSESLINWAFVGKGSLVCSQKDEIKLYGFGLLTAASGPNSCGDTSARAYAPAQSTATVTATPGSIKYGATITAKATVISNANGGGTVDFFGGDIPLGSAKLAVGATTVSAALKTSPLVAVGSTPITAVFTPTLLGVGEATSPAVAVNVSKASATVRGSTRTVRASRQATVSVSVSVTGAVATGTVTIKEGSKTLVSHADLSAGHASVLLPKLKKGTHKLTVYYSGSATVNSAKSSTVTLTVTS